MRFAFAPQHPEPNARRVWQMFRRFHLLARYLTPANYPGCFLSDAYNAQCAKQPHCLSINNWRERRGRTGLFHIHRHLHSTVIGTYKFERPCFSRRSPIHSPVLASAKNDLPKPSFLRYDIVVDAILVLEVKGYFLSGGNIQSSRHKFKVSGDDGQSARRCASWRRRFPKRRIRVHPTVRTADIGDDFGTTVVRCDLNESAAMRITQFGRLNGGKHFERFAIKYAEGAQIVADPQFLAVWRQDDVIGLAQPIGAGELLADDRHAIRINCGERCAFLPISALAFVRDISDLFI